MANKSAEQSVSKMLELIDPGQSGMISRPPPSLAIGSQLGAAWAGQGMSLPRPLAFGWIGCCAGRDGSSSSTDH